jgi:Ni,Fe-hydrogenase III small subunit
MPTRLRVFRVNTGSCGGCDAHIMAAVHRADDMTMVSTPIDADIWVITGIMTSFAHSTLVQIFMHMPTKPIIIAVGQCAITGAPFGKGGISEAPELPIAQQLLGCPPTHEDILTSIRSAGMHTHNNHL